MPQLLGASRVTRDSEERSPSSQRASTDTNGHRNMWSRLSLQKIGSWLKRDEDDKLPSPRWKDDKHGQSNAEEEDKDNGRPSADNGRPSGLLGRRSSRRVVPGLPRPLTFKRMNSEKRDKLMPVPVEPEHRRASSMDRRDGLALKRTLSPPPVSIPSMSAPDVLSPQPAEELERTEEKTRGKTIGGGEASNIPPGSRQVDYGAEESTDNVSVGEPPPLSVAGDSIRDDNSFRSEPVDEMMLQEELEAKWILNLSMHFRDMSDREKFFVTYAEEPNKWRRVTVSCDYRAIQPDSLEADLKGLHYQRDKSARIYEAIRDSLPAIQFYDTVTNLKLQTDDGRLHVHVTEDVNEIIPYPSVAAVDHLECKWFKESSVSFDSHISGFVYRVTVGGRSYIKKEIPGPDAVEEFLYEINALCSLQDSKSVIKFEGIIIDEKSQLLKGLLISYADQGALVDLIYDYKNTDRMPWERRERWARQIVEGLSEIHEAGFVQGDFTLSNIVVDNNDDAKIIDINRRGCPVGWEPPELARLIESSQRISIYIGVKSDIFQLGMVLWALAQQDDEPERQERPLDRAYSRHNTTPEWYREIVKACLEDSPRRRPAAKTLLSQFPDESSAPSKSTISRESIAGHRADKEYIDPATTVSLAEIRQISHHSPPSSSAVHILSTEYLGSSSSYILPNRRGRSPELTGDSNRRSDYSLYDAAPRSIMSLDDSEMENDLASLPASRDTRWEQVYVDGDTRFVQRGTLGIEARDFTTQESAEVCITTPPGELETAFPDPAAKGEDTPLQLSTIAELQPLTPPQATETTTITESNAPPSPINRLSHNASFSDRVHHLNLVDEANSVNNLAQLESEVAMDASITEGSISRTETGFSSWGMSPFSPPVHQDSGFAEPNERVSYEAERIRRSLDEDSVITEEEEPKIVEGRLWDEKDLSRIPEKFSAPEEKVLGTVAQVFEKIQPPTQMPLQIPVYVPPQVIGNVERKEKALEEKVSNTTIRPPSIVIPEFHHVVPKVMERLHSDETIKEEKSRCEDTSLEEKTSGDGAACAYVGGNTHTEPVSEIHNPVNGLAKLDFIRKDTPADSSADERQQAVIQTIEHLGYDEKRPWESSTSELSRATDTSPVEKNGKQPALKNTTEHPRSDAKSYRDFEPSRRRSSTSKRCHEEIRYQDPGTLHHDHGKSYDGNFKRHYGEKRYSDSGEVYLGDGKSGIQEDEQLNARTTKKGEGR